MVFFVTKKKFSEYKVSIKLQDYTQTNKIFSGLLRLTARNDGK